MSVVAPLLELSGRIACVLWGALILWVFARVELIHLPQDSDDATDRPLRERLHFLLMSIVAGLALIVFGVAMPTARFATSAVGVFFAYSSPVALVATVAWTRVAIIELRVAYHLQQRHGRRQQQGGARAVDTNDVTGTDTDHDGADHER